MIAVQHYLTGFYSHKNCTAAYQGEVLCGEKKEMCFYSVFYLLAFASVCSTVIYIVPGFFFFE